MAGGFGNRPSAKFGHVQPVLCARCDWRVCFSGRVSKREDFCFLREKRHFPQKMPIASASVNRAVHQRTECEKKHNRAPNRVPIRQILAARRGVAYSWEGGGVGVPTATRCYTPDDAPGSVWALWRLQCPFIYIFTYCTWRVSSRICLCPVRCARVTSPFLRC